MLLAHLLGASLVEGIITGLGFAYIQQHHPEYLTRLRGIVAGGPDVPTGEASTVPTWQLVGGGAVVLAIVLLGAGLITGGGNPAQLFGADWSSVDWPSVATMLLVVLVLAAILVPLAWFLLPRRMRGVGTAYVAAALLAPLGLIAPGFAFGEGSPEDLHQELGYIPDGVQAFSQFFSAPFRDYNLPLPFFDGADAPLWHAAIGYEIAGILGILAVGVVLWGLGALLLRRDPEPAVRSSGTVTP
jgi:cobalt/nickel transport protein